MTTTNQHGSTSRVPRALQAVFLAANQGQDVHQPPTDGTASKVFGGSSKIRHARWPMFARVLQGRQKGHQQAQLSEHRDRRFRLFTRPKRRESEARTKQSQSGKLAVDHTEQSSSSETCREEDNADLTPKMVRTQRSTLVERTPAHKTEEQPIIEAQRITVEEELKAGESNETPEAKFEAKEASAAISIANNIPPQDGSNNDPLISPLQRKSFISSRGFYNSYDTTAKNKAECAALMATAETPNSGVQPTQSKAPLSSRCFYGQSPVVIRSRYEDDGTITSGDSSLEEETWVPDEIQIMTEPHDQVQRSPQEQASKISPQTFLDDMLCARGYSTERFSSLRTGYSNKPTALQQASYGTHLVQCIRSRDKATVHGMMQAGLSPNACNAFGESILHLVCRCGDWQMLSLLLSYGASVQTADDFGRTPLHDVCWAPYPSFATVELILQEDARLLYVTDSRQTTPLSYVPQDHWAAWRDFLRENVDKYWPLRNVYQDGPEPAPCRALQEADSLPLPDPPNALPIRVAAMVAQGRLQSCEAILLANGEDEENEGEEDDEDDDDNRNDTERYASGIEDDSGSLGDYVSCDSDHQEDDENDSDDDDDENVSMHEEDIRLIMAMLLNEKSH